MSKREGILGLLNGDADSIPTEVADQFDRLMRDEISLAEADGIDRDILAMVADHGRDLLDAGKFDEARHVFELLTAYEPKESYHQLALGAVAQRDRRTEDAIAHYRRSIELDSENAYAWLYLGECLLATSVALVKQGRDSEASAGIQESLQSIQRAQELDPDAKTPAGQRARMLVVAAMRATGRTR